MRIRIAREQGEDYDLAGLSSVSPYRANQPFIDKLRLVWFILKNGVPPQDDLKYLEEFVVSELTKTKFGPYQKALLRIGLELALDSGSEALADTFLGFASMERPSTSRDIARVGFFLMGGSQPSLGKETSARWGLKWCEDKGLFRCLEYLIREPETRAEGISAAYFYQNRLRNVDPVIDLLWTHQEEAVDIGTENFISCDAIKLLGRAESPNSLRLLARIYEELFRDDSKFEAALVLAKKLKQFGRGDFERISGIEDSDVFQELMSRAVASDSDRITRREATNAILELGSEAAIYVFAAVKKEKLNGREIELLNRAVNSFPSESFSWFRKNTHKMIDLSFLQAFWVYLYRNGLVKEKNPNPERSVQDAINEILTGIEKLQSEKQF